MPCSQGKVDKLSFMKDEQKLDNLIFLIFLIPRHAQDIIHLLRRADAG